MKQLSVSALLLLLCGTFLCSAGLQESEYKTSDWTKALKNIKDGILKIHTYYTSYKYPKYIKNAVDLMLGSDGLCEFKCTDGGEKPFPRPGYNPPPNGCGSPLVGFHFALRIPLISSCCDQHDRCYDTCGQKKRDCDEQFQVCLKTICRNILKMPGLEQSVHACESGVSLVFDAIEHVGCKPYLESQKAACICHYEKKADL